MTIRRVFFAIYLSCTKLKLGWHMHVSDVLVFDGVHLLVILELDGSALLDIQCLFELAAYAHRTHCSSRGVAHRGEWRSVGSMWRLPERNLWPLLLLAA